MNEAMPLREIGLSDGESRAYLALLERGPCTAGPVCKHSGVSPSKIYDVLERLVKKGLVSYYLEGKVKYFRAAAPSRILEMLGEKEEALKEQAKQMRQLLPKLEQMRVEASKAPSAEIIQGIRGIKGFFDASLKDARRGEEIAVIGYPPLASKIFNAYFKDFHTRRAKLGIKGRVIYDYETWFLKEREKRRFLEQRYLHKNIKTPAFLYIYGDTVGTIVVTESQKLCFAVKNREVAQSYMEYFNLMWKTATKT